MFRLKVITLSTSWKPLLTMWTSLVLASLLAFSWRPPCMADRINRHSYRGDPGVTHEVTSWYNAKCVKDTDCHQENSVCIVDKCLCRPGFFFTKPDYTCSSSCSPEDMQNTFTKYPFREVKGHYIQALGGLNLQECKKLCVATTSCHTFDFKDKGGRCLIHITSHEAPRWHTKARKGWSRYQRNCRRTGNMFPGPDWYNASCHSDEECGDPYSRCLSGRCLCKLGSTIHNYQIVCVTAETCDEWQQLGAKSGAYYIRLTDNSQTHSHDHRVWCDMKSGGGGWLVFQRRRDGSVDFYRNWEEYEHGFGDVSKEFWLGLSILYTLTKGRQHRLRVDLREVNGHRHYAEYSSFSVGGPETNYRLTLSGYSGTAGNSMAYHNNRSFTTFDRDNDQGSGNCAVSRHGAWWYHWCHHSNLNGLYQADGASGTDGINWYHVHKDWRSFTVSEMKVQPV